MVCTQLAPHAPWRTACAVAALPQRPSRGVRWQTVDRSADLDFPQPKSPERDALSKPQLFHDGRPGEGQPGDDNSAVARPRLGLTCAGIAFTVNRLTSVASAAARGRYPAARRAAMTAFNT